MIFHDIRLSDLKADYRRRRENLKKSSDELRDGVVEFAHPLSLLKKYPFWLLGGTTAAMAAFKTVKVAAKRGGWMGKLVSLGGIFMVKNVLPYVTKAVIASLGAFAKKRSR